NQKDAKAGRTWLRQWILDPHVHSPRSRMPVTHMTPSDVADIAAWLLSQKNPDLMDLGKGWDELKSAQPDEDDLKKLADVYLVRLLTKQELKELKEKGTIGQGIKDLPDDEQDLLENYSAENIKYYLGKKAVGRQGCFACHDIPGFDNAKPIGVALNEWGKKDPDRLAFEDIANYVKSKFHFVPSLVDKDGKPVGTKEEGGVEKKPYEQFYAEALFHHQREGYLNQKIMDPRSYDYMRLRAWDDLARMPQFKFARLKQKEGESDEDFAARANKEEADAREAVATFILGLVAEPVPLKNINQPTGDRLAEVKGRQVLDKFNCGGCHLIRPGIFDFKLSDDVNESLENSLKLAAAGMKSDHVFLNHHNWVGAPPAAPDKLTAYGIIRPNTLAEEGAKEWFIRLSQALRFQDSKKKWRDLPSFSLLAVNTEQPKGIPIDQFLYPPPS